METKSHYVKKNVQREPQPSVVKYYFNMTLVKRTSFHVFSLVQNNFYNFKSFSFPLSHATPVGSGVRYTNPNHHSVYVLSAIPFSKNLCSLLLSPVQPFAGFFPLLFPPWQSLVINSSPHPQKISINSLRCRLPKRMSVLYWTVSP